METAVHLPLPQAVIQLLRQLEEAGFSAYAVGGCVRDALLGQTPYDWDITTSALPEEILRTFTACKCLTTGLQHGTVTVFWQGEPYEITTFRQDGDYKDHRHPTTVTFTPNLVDDLARRDFTINAMAYHPKTRLLDPFGGRQDLQKQVVRAVGNPTKRFTEDALRIVRGLRFASTLPCTVEQQTASAMVACTPFLSAIAKERITAEWKRLLLGAGCVSVLRQFFSIVFALFPSLAPMYQFPQHNPYHCYDVWEHTLHALTASPQNLALRLAVLFHDCGKPATHTRDASGIDHFYDHEKVSATLAKEALTAMRYETAMVEQVSQLILHHGLVLVPQKTWVKRQCNRFGTDFFAQLLQMKRCDTLGQSALVQPRLAEIRACEAIVAELLAENACLQVKDLAIGGRELLSLGFPQGKVVGQCLQYLLQEVLEERLPNDKATLLVAAKDFLVSHIENRRSL